MISLGVFSSVVRNSNSRDAQKVGGNEAFRSTLVRGGELALESSSGFSSNFWACGAMLNGV